MNGTVNCFLKQTSDISVSKKDIWQCAEPEFLNSVKDGLDSTFALSWCSATDFSGEFVALTFHLPGNLLALQ